jgi:hypothetical protein
MVAQMRTSTQRGGQTGTQEEQCQPKQRGKLPTPCRRLCQIEATK